jgi:hypothetical protein
VQYQQLLSIQQLVAWQSFKPKGNTEAADQERHATDYSGHHAANPSMQGVRTEMPNSTTTMLSSTSPRTMILFVTSRVNDLNHRRIAEMHQLFKNDFMVVWSNNENPTCPFENMKDAGLCIDKHEISKSRKLSHMCCAQETALMWAIDNRQSFDNVWIMEDDVYATDITELEKLINLESSADLFHQSPGGDFIPFQDHWVYANEVRRDAKGLFNTSEMKATIFNIFRMSKDFLAALEQVYIDLGKEWFFFEALFPSVVVSNRFNLTHASWRQHPQLDTNSTYVMTVTPRCMTHFEKPGIYHPVKYKNGNFASCPHTKFAPDVMEGSPYINQV